MDTIKTGKVPHEMEATLPIASGKDHRIRHMLVSTAPFGDFGNNSVVVSSQHITRRKRAYEALRESEEKYRRMFEDSFLGLFQSTPEGKILTVNPALAKMFGYQSPEELLASVGENAAKLYTQPADRSKAVQLVLESEAPVESETCYRRKDDSTFTGSCRIWKVRDEKVRPFYLQGCVEDITRRKQAEESLRESEKRLHFLSSRLFSAQENERRRISLEIHDDLAQNMAVLKLKIIEVAKGLRRNQEELKTKCDNILKFIDRIIGDMRRLSRDLRPAIIEDLKLGGTLQWMLNDFEKQTGIATTLKMTDIDSLFSHENQVILYRIFQEALSNIRKHAEARKVSVVIRKTDGQVVFQIQDDGKGFDIGEIWRRHVAERGMGLAAMDERARILGGRLEIVPQKGRGTRLVLRVPVAEGNGETSAHDILERRV